MMDERAVYEKVIKDNIQYDQISPSLPDSRKETLDELVDIMVSSVCSKRPTLRVNRESVPQPLVKARMLKLTWFHIEYVLDCLETATSKVGNILSYMLTSLYNAVSTINTYYKCLTAHDTASSAGRLPEPRKRAARNDQFNNFDQREIDYNMLLLGRP